MGYIPSPFPPKECFESEEDWYNYCREYLLEQQSQMPDIYFPTGFAICLIIWIIFIIVIIFI